MSRSASYSRWKCVNKTPFGSAPPPGVDAGALQSRLRAVSPALISPDQIQAARREGSSAWPDQPERLLQRGLERGRVRPVLGAALGLGMLDAATRRQDDGLRALALVVLSIALPWWGYHAGGASAVAEALALLDESSAGEARLYARWHQILNERRLRHLPNSFEQLVEIAARLEEAGDRAAAMRCRLDAAFGALSSRRHHDEAKRLLGEAERFFAAGGLEGERALCLILRADEHFNHGDLEAGLEMLDQAEGAFQEAGMPAMVGFVWMYRGIYFTHRRQMDVAERWLRKACERAEGLQHIYYKTLSLIQIAFLQYQRGDIHESLITHQAIRRLASELRLGLVAASSEMTAAHLRVRQGDYGAAAQGYRLAKTLFEEGGFETFAALCTMNLGIVARREGNFARSLRLLNEALQVFDAAQAYEHRANAHHNLGKTYAAFGYFEPAIEHFRQGIQILEEAGIPAQAVRPMINLAGLLARRGDKERARELLERAEVLAGEAGLAMDLALSQHAMADLLLQDGLADEALAAYRASLKRFQTLEQEEAAWEARQGIAASYMALGQVEAAARELETLNVEKLPASLRWRHHTLLARLFRLRRRPRQALEAYLEALTRIRAARRTLTREDEVERFALALQSVYEEAFGLAVELNDPAEALAIAELHGSQLVSVRLGYNMPDGDDPRDLPTRLGHMLRERLGDAWTVLRYAWRGGDLWVFMLSPDGLQHFALSLEGGARLALRASASPDDSFRRFVYLGQSAAQANAARMGRESRQRLFDTLLPEAVRERLMPDHTLLIVPSHQLHGLAFQALLAGETPLIEQTRLLYAPSLDVLRIWLQAQPGGAFNGGRGLIIAQSHFEQPGYNDLPHVEREAEAVLRSEGEQAERLAMEALNRRTLNEHGRTGQLALYDWLHIATHAHADPQTGTFTGLLTGPDILEVGDIQQWRLNARLVTLSACQAGLGRWYYGDEISGLAQAFLSAGARTVIASLWQTADDYTAQFMATFYAALRKEKSPVAALAYAQRQAHRAGVEAYYWAPFAAFGNP